MPSRLTKRQTAQTGMASSRFDFGRIAEHYDKWYRSRHGSLYDKAERRALDGLPPNASEGNRLLDIGCGTGHWSAYLAGKGFDVTGIDPSEQMIRIARGKNIAGSRFLVADGENIPFADNQFDVATAITSLEFTVHPKRVVSEMARCVKEPKGTLIVGMLNTLSPSNQEKKARPGSVYASADFLPPHGVEKLMSQFGQVDMRTAGFVPKTDWLLPLSPLLEYLCRFLGSKRGAFIAAKVQLWRFRHR